MRSDRELQRDLLNELRRDGRLRIDGLNVRVESSVVTLNGRVETPGQRWRALEVARRIVGPAPVANRITISAD